MKDTFGLWELMHFSSVKIVGRKNFPPKYIGNEAMMVYKSVVINQSELSTNKMQCKCSFGKYIA